MWNKLRKLLHTHRGYRKLYGFHCHKCGFVPDGKTAYERNANRQRSARQEELALLMHEYRHRRASFAGGGYLRNGETVVSFDDSVDELKKLLAKIG